MTERLIDIVEVPDQAGGPRWQALAPCGSVAGEAALRPIIPFGHEPVPVLTLFVQPRWRRGGIGSRLLAAVREQAGEPGLVMDVAADSPGEAFCRRHGFRRTGSRRHDLLTYCDVHRAWLGELVDAEPPGYRLAYWTGDLSGAADAGEQLRTPSRPGNSVLTAAYADGELAAYALAVVGARSEPRARQYGPVVLAGHRGRRLGVWVGAALIERLRQVHPHVTEIETVSGGDDAHLLGFRPHHRTRRYALYSGS